MAAVGTGDPPAPLGPTAGSGFCLLPLATSQSLLVPGLEGKTEIVLLDPSQSQ